MTRDSRNVLRSYLNRAWQARRRRKATWHALSVVRLLAGLLAVSIGALAFVPALRPWLLLVVGVVAVVGLGLALAALLRPARVATVGRWLARRDPELGGAIADAHELAARLDGEGRPVPATSADLAREHARLVAGRATEDEPARHARASIPRLPWRSAGAMTGVLCVALIAVPSGRRRLLSGTDPAERARIAYASVGLHMKFPAYLAMPDRDEPESSGDVQAPVGTHVTVSVRADRPVRSARLEPEGGAPVSMTIDGATATGTLVVVADGEYRIRLTGTGGEIDPEPPRHLVRAIPDLPPEVRLLEPRDDVEIEEGSALSVAGEALDDHGVAEMAVVVAPADLAPEQEAEAATRIGVASLSPTELQAGFRRAIDTVEMNLGAGDEAMLWIEARDADDVSGPKWAASSRIRIRVPSPEEELQELDMKEQELAEHLLSTLAGHLVAAPDRLAGPRPVAEIHEQFMTRLEQSRSLLGEVIALASARGDDLAASSALEDMLFRLEALTRARQRRGDEIRDVPLGLGPAAHAALHPREIEELEADVLFFDMWADRRASVRAADTAEELLAAVQRLIEQLERDQPAASDQELEQALAEAERLRDSLEPQVEALAESGGADPADAAAARDALARLQERLAAAKQALARRDRGSMGAQAARMERTAADLADLVESMARAGALGDPELAREMEQAMGDLRRIRREQADLRDDTNKLREEARAAMSPEDVKRADELFADLLRLADEAVAAEAEAEDLLGEAGPVKQYLEALDEGARVSARIQELLQRPDLAEPERESRMERLSEERARALASAGLDGERVERWMRFAQGARESLGRMRQVIADRELPGIERPARWSLDALTRLGDALGEEREEDARAAIPPLRTASAKVGEILDLLDELEQQVERASQGALTSAQRERMAGMGQRQAQLEARSRELAGRMRDLGSDVPFLGDGVAQSLDAAGGSMDQAATGLNGRQPGEAAEHQGEAMAHLDEALDAMEPGSDRGDGQSRGAGGQQPGQQGQRPGDRRGRQHGRGRDGRYGPFSREMVEIPDADAFHVPKEFREEILEAMRESDPPEGYEEQVREYYRRLVE